MVMVEYYVDNSSLVSGLSFSSPQNMSVDMLPSVQVPKGSSKRPILYPYTLSITLVSMNDLAGLTVHQIFRSQYVRGFGTQACNPPYSTTHQ